MMSSPYRFQYSLHSSAELEVDTPLTPTHHYPPDFRDMTKNICYELGAYYNNCHCTWWMPLLHYFVICTFGGCLGILLLTANMMMMARKQPLARRTYHKWNMHYDGLIDWAEDVIICMYLAAPFRQATSYRNGWYVCASKTCVIVVWL